jgi:hypothetical protein
VEDFAALIGYARAEKCWGARIAADLRFIRYNAQGFPG